MIIAQLFIKYDYINGELFKIMKNIIKNEYVSLKWNDRKYLGHEAFVKVTASS